MSIAKKVLQLRKAAHRTQVDVAESAGMAVSYLSRIENDRLKPSVRTLGRIAKALNVPLPSLFDSEPVLEPGEICPVSASGRCILNQLHSVYGRTPRGEHGYSTEQLEVLRMCDFLLHQPDGEILRSLTTLMRSLLALAESRGQREKG